jgi:stage II sporulation protein D
VASFALASGDAAAELRTWRLEGETVHSDTADDAPYPVGSLLKPFVAKAWARAYSGERTPSLACDRRSGCWRPSGHGRSDLARALAVSCNAYFRALATEVPLDGLGATLASDGFIVPEPLTADTAIGLVVEGRAVLATPSALLHSYRRLTREPWEAGEPVRREVLAGLREGALSGTASGIARWGYWAKTGTVPSVDGRALSTTGWVIAIDDAGWAILGLLPDGTGTLAAQALAGRLARMRPMTGGPAPPHPDRPRHPDDTTSFSRAVASSQLAPPAVRVSLFSLLAPRALVARNVGGAPVRTTRGYLGPGAAVGLRAGDRLEEGLWELRLRERGFSRRLAGSVACDAGASGALRVRAEVSPREYVAGVLRAELPEGGTERRLELGAAVLRFLAAGPRHESSDVCDATHCAWFVGRGPRLLWPAPDAPVVLAARGEGDGILDAGTWQGMLAAAREDGPRHWSSHCGGEPLSPHYVWGIGDRRVRPCPRHARPGASWTRRFSDEDLARALGQAVTSLAVTAMGGVWSLRVVTADGARSLGYDDAHRRLAAVHGWDALPSPARGARPVPGGWELAGVGRGHRVGLCLAD